jgi:hypothetical protein
MSEKQSKPPEILQAQAAAFAHEKIEDYKDRDYILSHIAEVSAGDLEDITRTTEKTEYHKNESGDSIKTPIGTKRTIVTSPEYIDYLRKVGGSRSDVIKNRADILRAYNTFEFTVESLMRELETTENTTEHPSFLGNGSNSRVFSLEVSGHKYAVRKIRSAESVNSHLAGAVLAKGIPHLEQIVAASFEKGITVAEIMSGRQFGDLTVEEIKQITDDQLEEFLDTIMTANKRGIKFDQKPSNYLYDAKSGFGIVDLTSGEQDLASAVHVSFTNMGIYGKWGSCNTTEEYALQLEFHKANIDVLKRYRAIIGNKIDGDGVLATLKNIDRDIDAVQNSINEYADPQWVAGQINKPKANESKIW